MNKVDIPPYDLTRQKNPQRTPAKEALENSRKRTPRELQQKSPRRTPAKEPPENSGKRTLRELRQTSENICLCSPMFSGDTLPGHFLGWPKPMNLVSLVCPQPMQSFELVCVNTNEFECIGVGKHQ
jgi:hypothetical protein